MGIRLIRQSTGEEIRLAKVRERNGTYFGKVDVLTCRGDTLALFHELEELANATILGEADRVAEAIDRLGFLADGLPNVPGLVPCEQLQLMNGDDVSFRVSQTSIATDDHGGPG